MKNMEKIIKSVGIKNIIYKIATGKGLINTSLFVLLCIFGVFLIPVISWIATELIVIFADQIFIIVLSIWDVIKKPVMWFWHSHLIGYIIIAFAIGHIIQSVINYCNRILSALNEIDSSNREILNKLSHIQNAIVFSDAKNIPYEDENFIDK